MKWRDWIALGCLALSVADVIPKKHDDEEGGHTHEDEAVAEPPTRVGEREFPDSVTPTLYTVRRYLPDIGLEITDRAYSWQAILLQVRERFECDNPSARPEDVKVQIGDGREATGQFWLFTFAYGGMATRYRVQSWNYCGDNLQISKSQRNQRDGWIRENEPPISVTIDEDKWDRAILTIRDQHAWYRRVEPSKDAPHVRYYPGKNTFEQSLIDATEMPDEVIVFFLHTHQGWRFIRE